MTHPAEPLSSPRVERRRLRALRWTLALALAAAAIAATGDAWSDIVRRALKDEEQSHALLVPVVFGWLVWVRRERLRHHVPTHPWVGPVLVAAGWGLNALGDAALFQAFWHLGAIVVAAGAVLTVAGGGLLTRLLPAFASLLFLVPVNQTVRLNIAAPLQSATAAVTREVLELFGAEVERIGSTLRINHQDVLIAEACNGMRMAFSLFLVCFVFAYGIPLRNWARITIIALSPVTAIAFNVVRLVPVVWAYGTLDADVARTIHDVSGWVMLPCAFLALLGVMRALRWAQIPVTPNVLAYGV